MLPRNSALAVIPTRRVSLKGTLFLALIEYTLFFALIQYIFISCINWRYTPLSMLSQTDIYQVLILHDEKKHTYIHTPSSNSIILIIAHHSPWILHWVFLG